MAEPGSLGSPISRWSVNWPTGAAAANCGARQVASAISTMLKNRDVMNGPPELTDGLGHSDGILGGKPAARVCGRRARPTLVVFGFGSFAAVLLGSGSVPPSRRATLARVVFGFGSFAAVLLGSSSVPPSRCATLARVVFGFGSFAAVLLGSSSVPPSRCATLARVVFGFGSF